MRVNIFVSLFIYFFVNSRTPPQPTKIQVTKNLNDCKSIMILLENKIIYFMIFTHFQYYILNMKMNIQKWY